MEIQIIADSCCDLTPTQRRVLRVRTASLTIRVDDREFTDDESLDIPALMAAMKQSANAPATACPAPEVYAAMMAQAPMTFVVTLSSRLSGSYNAACVGRGMALEADPSLKICVLDSESASAGETRIVMLLRDLIDANLSFEEIEQRVRAFIAPMRTRFVLEDLSHLVKNGRISKMAGFVGTVLNLRPLMADNGHGEIVCLEKIRGTANAMKKLVEHVAAETADAARASLVLVLSYCNCAPRALELQRDLLASCAALKDVIMVPTGGISTVYADDGGVVLAF
jgi:DegV family protein